MCQCLRTVEEKDHIVSGQFEVYGDLRSQFGDLQDERTWSNISRQSWIGEISCRRWTGGSIPQLLQLVLVLFLETERGRAILGVKPHMDDQL